MKTFITAACFLSLAANLSAFDLPGLDAAAVRTAETAAIPEPLEKRAGNSVERAYETVKSYYESSSYTPFKSDIEGTWEGRLFTRDPQGALEAKLIEISFETKTYPSELGPMFQEDRTEIVIRFPYYEALIERSVSFDPVTGMSFQFQWDGLFTANFRKANLLQGPALMMKTNCYSDPSYGYFMKKRPADKQAYSGALPLGDLFGPLPPNFVGQMPPLQVNGQAVRDAYEYSNRIIFYKDQAEALTAAEKAAAAIRAAGPEVLTVKAEELNGFYYTSVGFSGKKAILYSWADDAPTAGEAAEIVKRKTDRYKSEGYSILETNINKVGNKHFFFIICAKFY